MSDEPSSTDPPDSPPGPQAPRPVVFIFAAAFVVAMFLNMVSKGSDALTMFLASSALLTIGVDVGKMIGRR